MHYTDQERALMERMFSEDEALLKEEFQRMLKDMEGAYENAISIASNANSPPGAHYDVILERLNRWRSMIFSERRKNLLLPHWKEHDFRSIPPFEETLTRIVQEIDLRIKDIANRQAKIVKQEVTSDLEFRADIQKKSMESMKKINAKRAKS